MMTTVLSVTLTCPVCDTAFETQLLTSTNTIGPRTTDLRALAAGFQPQEFLVHTCPTCGYSAFDDQFTSSETPAEPVEIDPAVAERVRESIAPLVRNRTIDAPRKWELAALVAGWNGEPAQDLGWFHLNAAWCCDDLLAMEEAARAADMPTAAEPDGESSYADRQRQYRQQAAAEFEHALTEGNIAEDERAMYTYLVGELYRRTGDDDTASQWFHRAIAGAGDVESEWAALAERQLTDPTELIDQD